MKIIYKVICLTFSFFLTVSCGEKFLDVSPTDKLSDMTFWKTEKDAEMALAGIYNKWEEHTNILWWDLMTDNGFSQYAWDNVQVLGNGQANASNFGKDYFNYTLIRKYNQFIEKVPQIEMDAQKKEKMLAEARFLRAYDYFRKVQFYGDVPLVTEVIENPEDAKIGKTPKAEVVSFILSELDAVSKILPAENMRQSGGHVTSGAALALKARLELYEGKYADAMADSKKVLDMAKNGVYKLYPDYFGLFQVENESNNMESVLEIQYIKDTYANNIWQHILPSKEGGWSSISAVQSIVDAYEMKDGKTITESALYNPDKPFENRDPRLGMTILYSGAKYNGRFFNTLDLSSPDFYQSASAPKSGYNVLKYTTIVPEALLNNGDANVMVIRLAEVLLTYAEAAIESGQITADVYDAMDMIRARAKMPAVDRTVYNTQAKLRELVRRERRIELAFEGLRYWDIKRWDIGAQALNGPVYGSRLGTMNNATGVVTWNGAKIKVEDRVFVANRKYLLPIPQAELDANPAIEQNAGY
ncbi:RagB/SusD family nutrient uptake outer membrane protein [Dyadobacter sediminis]|uniref:RagB/SusD family nutrient uptake outer membrane protein n=1 Tax=Dyadobacter sediminis TaxID=1493691 RepID=A0A5R9K889_9BACT|nr:RagB/SusD family nutrient uptake outer membrane protein [Dyadobacter sediminis]TLU90032.1 RagB/SusD family nutrient uptake outer membrane protein [Dyadobacter sediminis]GGC10754.1 membrane protein [Dyadobacter sediminis]